MKHKHVLVSLVVAGALAMGAGLAVCAEAPATATAPAEAAIALPDAAKAAIAKAFPNATVGKVSNARGRGAVSYLVAMTEGDKKFDVRVTESGVIVSVATPVKLADLPKVVADAVTANAEGAKVDSATKVEMRVNFRTQEPLEKPMYAYAIHLIKGDEEATLMVAEDGTVRRTPQFRPISK
jgi:hypothetical protein